MHTTAQHMHITAVSTLSLMYDTAVSTIGSTVRGVDRTSNQHSSQHSNQLSRWHSSKYRRQQSRQQRMHSTNSQLRNLGTRAAQQSALHAAVDTAANKCCTARRKACTKHTSAHTHVLNVSVRTAV
jgi:hypothetical protein